MTSEEAREALELELKWRWDELRAVGNKLEVKAQDEAADLRRKAIVLMLYAHFEGFVKNAFQIYALAINQKSLTCADAKEPLVASALSSTFKAYDDLDRKSKVFRNALPDDSKLHKLSRQVDLLTEVTSLDKKALFLPVDDVCDTGSNVWPWVLKKILFRLGFDHDALVELDGTLMRLVNKRNNIAHGAERKGVSAKEYELFRADVDYGMKSIARLVVGGLRSESYRRITAA